MPLIELSFHRVVIPGADQESTHYASRVVISSSCHSIELSFLAQTRNPPVCVSSSCHSWSADQESTGLSIQGDSWIPGLRQE